MKAKLFIIGCIVLSSGCAGHSLESFKGKYLNRPATDKNYDSAKLLEKADIATSGSYSLELVRKAAQLDNPFAYVKLGYLYLRGDDVPRDYAKAKMWFTKAADAGVSNAQLELGNMYKKGLGVDKDSSEAIKWYLIAAEQGNMDSLYNLGYLYEGNYGVKQDYKKARVYYRRGANLGSSMSAYQLAVLASEGFGGKKEYFFAIDTLEELIVNGDPDAYNRLGEIYTQGLGVHIDIEKGLEYYRVSADKGDLEA
ncbi:MAG: sel1 repeat family protein, partial [Francisellaceae bacterium]|nr:sel1 repeat family protein [Francisellaceae bacterium]